MTEKLRLDLGKAQLPMVDTGMKHGISNPVKNDKTKDAGIIQYSQEEFLNINTNISTNEPKLAKYGINLNKPFKITKEMVEKMRAKGKKGFWENLKDGVKNAIPFLSGFIEIKKSIDLAAIVNKQKRGEQLSNKEKETLYLHMLEQVENEHRGSSFMGKVGEMISHLPAFAGEFFLTGGLYSLGKNLAGKAATKLVGDVTKKQFLTRAGVEVAGVATGAAFRTVALSNTYSGIFARRLKTDTSKLDEDGLGEIELKETDESMAASIGKGFLDGYIESFSEQSGEWFSKIFGKIPFLGKILTPQGKAGAFMAKTGFNGLFEEYAEERFGGTLRALTGLDERENVSFGQKLYDAIIPGWEQTGVELTTTAIWGGALSTGHRSAAKAKQFIKNAAQNKKVKDAITRAKLAANNAMVAETPYVQVGLEQIPPIPAAAAQMAGALSATSSEEAVIATGVLSDNNSLEAKNDVLALKKSAAKIRAEFETWLSEKSRFDAKEVKRLARIINAENINHIKTLVEISTANGKPRFDIYEIRQLAKIVNNKNIDCITKLAKLAKADGSARLKEYFLDLAEFVNNKNINCIVKLAELLNTKRELRFDEKDILFIARVSNDNNIDFIEELAGLLNAKRKERFDAYDIAKIIGVVHESNKGYVKNLLAMKTKDGRPRFDSDGIRCLAIATNERNKKYVHDLINLNTQDGMPRFGGLEIGSLALVTNEKNKDYVKELLDMVNKDGKPRFNGLDIKYIAEITNKKNKDYVKELLDMVNKDGSPRLSGSDIKDIVKITNEKNKDYIKELLELKESDGTPKLGAYEITHTIDVINENNIDFIKELVNLKIGTKSRFSYYEIISIAKITNENNIDFIRNLTNMKTFYGTPIFNGNDIKEIGSVLNTKNINFITLWVMENKYGIESRFSCSEIAVIAGVVNENNENLINELINLETTTGKPRFDCYGIAEIAGVANANNWGFVKELMGMETQDGLPQFDGCEIGKIAQLKGININYIKELIDIVNNDGKPRFSGREIASIAEATDEENKGLIKELIDMVNNDGKPRFNGFHIKYIAEITNKKNKDYIKELLELKESDGTPKLGAYEITDIIDVINENNIDFIKELQEMKTEDGKNMYDIDNIARIAEFANNAQNVRIIRELLDPNISFLNFDEITLLAKFCSKIDTAKNMPFSTKILILRDLKDALNYIEESEAKKAIEEKAGILEKSMNQAIEPISVSKKAIADFLQAFLTTANKENAKVIKSLNSFIEKYNESGFPLEFSREDFVKELAAVLESLSEEQKTAILEKLGIQLDNDTYEGFINLRFDSKTPAEAKIKKLCERFLLENKINTGNEQIDNFLNSLIKGMPELVNIIGKKAGVHDYTLDAHTLKVLCEVVSNPQFETLSNQDKMIAQLVALLHDVGKLSGVNDTGHEHSSSIVANDILKKVSMPEFMKRRVVELIKNHNWLQLFNEAKIDAKTAAAMFRNPEDIKIAEIFAEADLKGVGEDFHLLFSGKIKPAIEEITKELETLYSGGNMIFPTRILNLEKIPEVEHNGQKYKVLDITKLPDDVDLSQFGLSVKDKKDLRFLFHSGELGTMQILMNPFNEGHVCTTLISPSKKFTFGQIKCSKMDVGMMIDAPNANVINSAQIDQYSPMRGGFAAFVDMAFNNEINNYTKQADRFFQKEVFLSALSKKYNIKESEYKEIYKELINKRFWGQITDITLSSGITIKAEDIINAYKAVEDKIMQYTASEINEVNIYNPLVTGVIVIGNSLSDIPSQTLKHVRENNLPIFILGN